MKLSHVRLLILAFAMAVGSAAAAPMSAAETVSKPYSAAVNRAQTVSPLVMVGIQRRFKRRLQDPAVCCVKGRRVWKTTAGYCRRQSGAPTNMSYCREVCCVKGQRVWKTTTTDCRRNHGAATNMSYCRPVCCKKGSQYWNTISVTCRRAGGSVATNSLCRPR